MKKEYGVRPPMQKQFGVRPEAQDFNPNHDDRGEFSSGSGGGGGSSRGGRSGGLSARELGSAPTIRGGFKFGAGERVRIRGGPDSPMATRHAGKLGRVSTVSPSGDYYGVVDSKGKHMGYFHQSDLTSV